jgi:hypothetical protein
VSYEYHLAFWFWSSLVVAAVGVPMVAAGVRRVASLVATRPHGAHGGGDSSPTISFHSSPRPSSPGW